MSDFAFQIVGDASKANQSIDGVVSSLGKIPPAAQRAGAAINSAMSEAQRLTRQHEDSIRGATQRAEQLNAALQREADVLNRIRGPLRENVADMQALMTLYRTGQINAHQYAAEVDKLRTSIMATNQAASKHSSGFDVGSALGSLPGGSIAAGFVGGGVAGAAQAGVQTAVGAAHQLVEMSDAYVNMNNRLRTLTGTSAGAQEALGKIADVANRTRSDLGATTEAFVRISNATKQMGLSEAETIAFTERLNEITQLSGASTAEAQASMLQLSQALASGTLRGDEFNSINEQMHPLITLIAQKLHVSEGALRSMAEQGQLTGKIVYDSVNQAGAAIDQQFAQTTPTVAAQFTVLKNEATLAVGKLAQSVDLSKTVGATIKTFGEIAQKAGEQTKFWADQLDRIGVKPGDLTGGGWEGMSKLNDMGMDVFKFDFFDKGAARMNDAQQVINRAIAEGSGKLREYSQTMVEQTLRTYAGADAAKAFADAMYKGSLDPWANAAYRANTASDYMAIGLRTLGQVMDKVNEKQKKFVDYYKEMREAAVPRNIVLPKIDHSVTNIGMVHPQGLYTDNGPPDYLRKDAISEAEKLVNAQSDALIKANGRINKAQEDLRKRTDENAQHMKEAYADVAGSIAADLVNAFAAGDVSAEKLMRKAALLVLQLGAGQIGGAGGSFLSALAGGLGGGKNGFDYRVGSSGLQLPGLQSGGSITRQAGGPEPLLAMWWMQPNETLSIRTEEQQRRAQAGAGGGGPVNLKPEFKLLMPKDDRDIVDDSRAGLTTLVRLQQRVSRSRR